MLASSVGNEDVMIENGKYIGSNDVDMVKLILLNFKPIRDERGLVTSMDCTQVISSNEGQNPKLLKRLAKNDINSLE